MKITKIKKYKRSKMMIIITLVVLILFGMSHSFNQSMEPQLNALAKQHTSVAINKVVKEVLSSISYNEEDLMSMKQDTQGEILSISYNSNQLNNILHTSLKTIDASLLAAQEGNKDPTLEEVFYKDGIVYQVPLGYFTHLFFLYNKGPKLNVRMKLLNDVVGEIKTTCEPYGMNSTMIKISLAIVVEAQAITFLNITPMKCTNEIPLVIQVVNGKIPAFVPYTTRGSS
ncbi:MAG: sporulation protein YunB [Longicatena sp.]